MSEEKTHLGWGCDKCKIAYYVKAGHTSDICPRCESKMTKFYPLTEEQLRTLE
jgi:uncharacterized Zn finger protein (UPF0148 family)